ncbi:major facilitator superfamily multidrug-resistance, DHA1 sub-family [Mycena albidolilacea]|uniref:Major facilitator superfamily multidrug-resistance, DHA1 sub-family n=1 Tax=Mycena albidolilacea TaxID=1033008 RepID=A0AAD7EVI9_9AGAR|nr:major facilitator superfamily multidrug-resistance, DHA1 sub-family [Mycena albidolilacea]
MADSEIETSGNNAEAVKKRVPIPRFQVAIILLIQFAEPITALVIYPFVVQFVRDTGVTGGEETKTGFYAGLLESAFFLTESLTVFQFGRWSDIYGRRPIILLGPLGLAISMLGFGISKTFWSLFFFRCIQGACNGNIGVTKTVINEISDPSNIADIFSIMPLVWSVASTMAPLIGGVLSNPATKWPSTLGKFEILREHPYLLPCVVSGSIALLAFGIAFAGLKESLPSIVARRRKNTAPVAETDPLLPTVPHDSQNAPPPIRDLLIRPVFIALANHGLLCFCHMGNDALVPLFFATPISLGGLGLRPQDIGLILSICGICNALVQVFFGGWVIRRFGPRRVFIAGFCTLVIQFAMYPLIGFLVRRAGRVDAVAGIALAFQLSGTFVLYFSYAATLLFTMDAAPSRASLGSVNGLAQMVGTVFRSLAPSFSSSLFALSAEHHLAGGNLVYIVLGVATLGAVRCSLLLPRKLGSDSKK